MPYRSLGPARAHRYYLSSREIDHFKQHIPCCPCHVLHLVSDAVISMRAAYRFACSPGALCRPLAAVGEVYLSNLVGTFGCFDQLAKGVMLAVGYIRSEYLFGQPPCLAVCRRCGYRALSCPGRKLVRDLICCYR